MEEIGEVEAVEEVDLLEAARVGEDEVCLDLGFNTAVD